MKVLYLRASGGRGDAYPYFVQVVGGRCSVEVKDPDRSIDVQFEGVGVVVGPGGAAGTRTLIDAALAADVRLWQVT